MTPARFPGLAGFGAGLRAPSSWEREQVDAMYRDLADRREREESDRRIAEEAAAAGFACCSVCGAWTRPAEERCDQCAEPVDGGSDPLYRLSMEALRRRAANAAEGV